MRERLVYERLVSDPSIGTQNACNESHQTSAAAQFDDIFACKRISIDSREISSEDLEILIGQGRQGHQGNDLPLRLAKLYRHSLERRQPREQALLVAVGNGAQVGRSLEHQL